MCLRLLGDAIMYLDANEDGCMPFASVDSGLVYPFVDAGMNSRRERVFNWLVVQAFSGRNVLRGGVLSGYRGVGISHLVRNVVLAKQLVSWATGALVRDAEFEGDAGGKSNNDGLPVKHVGIHVSDPGLLNEPLRQASPAALVAAGLYRLGLLKEPGKSVVPAWAVPSREAFNPVDVVSWLESKKIDCALVVDEAQRVFTDRLIDNATRRSDRVAE